MPRSSGTAPLRPVSAGAVSSPEVGRGGTRRASPKKLTVRESGTAPFGRGYGRWDLIERITPRNWNYQIGGPEHTGRFSNDLNRLHGLEVASHPPTVPRPSPQTLT